MFIGEYDGKCSTIPLIIAMALMLISCFVMINSSYGADVYISNSNSTIKEAIHDTHNDKVHLSPGEYKGENNRNIIIDRNVSMVSNKKGAIINAEKKERLFTVNSGSTLKLTNITLTNGYSNYNLNYNSNLSNNQNFDYGGAIFVNKGGQLIAENCRFINNRGWDGSAIFNNGGRLTLTACVFQNNTADEGKTIALKNGGTATGNLINGGTNSYIDNLEQFKTKLTLTSVFKNGKVYITAFAFDEYNQCPIVGESITFKINNQYSANVTNSKGITNLIYTPLVEGILNIKASLYSEFSENKTDYVYLKSSAINTINIKFSKKDIKVKVITQGDDIKITLIDSEGSPVIGKFLMLRDRSANVLGTTITDSKGKATFTYTGDKSKLQISFNGDDLYNPITIDFSKKTNKTNSGKNKIEPDHLDNSSQSDSIDTTLINSDSAENSINSHNGNSSSQDSVHATTMKKNGVPVTICFLLLLIISVLGLSYKKKL